jgi:HK97 family phage major capsid protein
MNKKLGLEQERAALRQQAAELAEQLKTRVATPEDLASADSIEQRVKSITDTLNAEQRMAALGNAQTDQRGGNGQVTSYPRERILDKPFANIGEQMHAAIRSARNGGRDTDPRLLEINERAALGMNEKVPSDGGFFVQPEFVAEVLKRTYETGQVASRCRRLPLTTSNSVKINGIDETSRANGSRWGGIRAYWADEAASLTGSRPKFRKIELTLGKLTGLFYMTDELEQDASLLTGLAQQAVGEEFGFVLDDSIMNGTGAGAPLGVVGAPCAVSVAKESGQSAATIVPANITKMWSRMWARSRQNAVWFINQDVEPQLNLMTLPVGTGGVPVYMPANNMTGSPYSTLYGRPVIPIEQCQTLGTVGDIVLFDGSQYLVVDRGGVQSAVSMHVQFVTDELVFRFIYRVDGQPIWHQPLTPFKGTNTLSPFVTLATRA